MAQPRDIVSEWLTRLDVAGGALSLDDDGLCALETETGLRIAVEVPENEPIVLVYAAVGPLPEDPDEYADLCAAAMEANLYQAETMGGSLATHDAFGHMLLCYRRELEHLSAEGFGALLDICAERTEALRGLLFPPRGTPVERLADTPAEPAASLGPIIRG